MTRTGTYFQIALVLTLVNYGYQLLCKKPNWHRPLVVSANQAFGIAAVAVFDLITHN